MASEGFKRKLTAILSADAKDYSRLMGEDETSSKKPIARPGLCLKKPLI